MFWEALATAAIGLFAALASTRWLPTLLPMRRLTLGTGPGAALFGAFVAHSALGPGHPMAVLVAGAAMAVAALSLLVRPRPRQGLRSAAV